MGILGGGSNSAFDKQLENATSQMQLEPNWQAILDICDSIRQKDVPAKYAIQSIKRKAFDKNPHVSKFALVVLEACMKNCGSPVHDEVSSKEFMDDLRYLAKNGSQPVKEQVLTLLQAWNSAFRSKPNYKIFQDTYNVMKMEGYEFPSVSENDAMFSAESAPEWAEGDVCNMCRVKFTMLTRQHHCRCCGQVFCNTCSSKSSIIPKYGIEKPVRVCDPCYDSINPSGAQGSPAKTKADDGSDLPSEYLNHPLSKEAQVKPKASEDELKAQEEEDLQLAMALSLSAQETDKTSSGTKKWSSMSTAASAPQPSSAPTAPYQEPKSDLYSDVAAKLNTSADSSDPELSRYLNRSYWEQKKQEKSVSEPSAPLPNAAESTAPARSQVQRYPQGSSEPEQEDGTEVFVQTMKNSLAMFVERMQQVSGEGKHIATDTSVQALFQSLSAMHPQLMRLIEEQDVQKAKYEGMLQKISLIREARESLNDVRAQHKEKLRQQELEQEMLRRMQMEQKLELMRQQKQEYLEYQHQLQIQRQQELEAQQQIKMQQKQMIQQQPNYPYQPMAEPGMPPPFPGYPQYQPVPEGYPVTQAMGQRMPQDASTQAAVQQPALPGMDSANAYPVSSAYGPYPGPPSLQGQAPTSVVAYPGGEMQPPHHDQVSKPPFAIQQPGMSPSHRPLTPNQDPALQPVVPPSSTVEHAQQPGPPTGMPMRPPVPQSSQPLHLPPQQYGPQQVQSSQPSQTAVSNLLDAPIGTEVDPSAAGYAPTAYGMSGPHSQDFNLPSYNLPSSQNQPPVPQGQPQPTGPDYSQPPQQYGPPQQQMMLDMQGQPIPGQPFQPQPGPQQLPQQQQKTPQPVPQQQQQLQQQLQPQPGQYPSPRFGQPQAPPFEQQGHVSPQMRHRMMAQPQQQPYSVQQPPANTPRSTPQDPRSLQMGPASLQYLGPQEQMAPNRGPASLPPNINTYPNGSQGYRVPDNVPQGPFVQQQGVQQQAHHPQQTQPPQQPQLQQQHYPQQPQLQQPQFQQQQAMLAQGAQPRYPGGMAEPQQDIPPNSHLRDMALISFD